MESFEFELKTRIFFGRGQEKRVGSIVKDYGFKKVLLHYGQGSVVKSGLLDLVKHSLTDAGSFMSKWAELNPIPSWILLSNYAISPTKSMSI
jgi:alcohol dehydrogenase YqhD (iron-dependent ADH family)